MTDEETNIIMKLIGILREHMGEMTDEERLATRDDVMQGYCQYCGGTSFPCYCMRDN